MKPQRRWRNSEAPVARHETDGLSAKKRAGIGPQTNSRRSKVAAIDEVLANAPPQTPVPRRKPGFPNLRKPLKSASTQGSHIRVLNGSYVSSTGFGYPLHRCEAHQTTADPPSGFEPWGLAMPTPLCTYVPQADELQWAHAEPATNVEHGVLDLNGKSLNIFRFGVNAPQRSSSLDVNVNGNPAREKTVFNRAQQEGVHALTIPRKASTIERLRASVSELEVPRRLKQLIGKKRAHSAVEEDAADKAAEYYKARKAPALQSAFSESYTSSQDDCHHYMVGLEEALEHPYMETPREYLQCAGEESVMGRSPPHSNTEALAMLEGQGIYGLASMFRFRGSNNSSMHLAGRSFSYTAPSLLDHPAFRGGPARPPSLDLEWAGDELEDFRQYVQATDNGSVDDETSDHMTSESQSWIDHNSLSWHAPIEREPTDADRSSSINAVWSVI